RDEANACFIELKATLEESGVALATEDIHPPENAALVIDFNVQSWGIKPGGGAIRYLITGEPPVISSENWSSAVHKRYAKIFTWDDRLVDNKKFFLLRYAHNLGVESALPDFEHRRLAAMINGFKS